MTPNKNMKHIHGIVATILLFVSCSIKTDIEEDSIPNSYGIDEHDISSIEIYEKTGIILGQTESFHIDDDGDTIFPHLIQQYNEESTLSLWYWEDENGDRWDSVYYSVDENGSFYDIDSATIDTIHRVKFN